MEFNLFLPQNIIFGKGTLNRLPEVLPQIADRFLVVMSGTAMRQNGTLERIENLLKPMNIELVYFDEITGEPSPEMVDAAAEVAIRHNCNGVIGLGGGSAMDSAKAAAALATNRGDVTDYLEGVGTGRQIKNPPLPFVAIPTTAGTGAEATKNAVISSKTEKFKKSFRHQSMLARLAIVDPELTLSVPKHITATTGMDAITQLIESYTSKKSTDFTNALCLHALRRANSLIKAYDNGNDIEAREDMCICSLYSGIALANSGLGAAHGFAAGLGAIYPISHGEACAIMLPHVMRINQHAAMEKFAHIGDILTGKTYSSALEASNAAIEHIEKMVKHVGIPADLKHLHIHPSDLEEIAHASQGSSMSGNPVQLSIEECVNFLSKLI